MKKILSVLSAISLLSFAFSATVNAADADKSIQQKSIEWNTQSEQIHSEFVSKATKKFDKIKEKLKLDKDFVIVQEAADGNFSVAAADPNANIGEIEAKLAEFSAQGTQYKSLLGIENATSPGGSTYQTEFATDVVYTGLGELFADDTVTFSGYSKNTFTSSVTPDSINASETFSYGYIGTSATFSYPPGLSVSNSGSSITLNFPQISNSKIYQHFYNDFKGKAYDIISISQSSAATFLAGVKSFSISAYDSEVF